eukprot:c20648_g1_i2.p1 GENE.c20648_g1_i2~~c20648_g1_i2.p1  ORF type:complete len:886 (+),score=337.67 c20648_g1_i2:1034-3691(+)
MTSQFQFQNLCGTVYRKGNLVFTSDGNRVLSPVGNRVTCFDLVQSTSVTLPFENHCSIQRIALSPNDLLLVSVDEDGKAWFINFKLGRVIHRFSFNGAVRDLKFSPCGNFLAVTHEKEIRVWVTPSLDCGFRPLQPHRIFKGLFDDATCLDWSSDSRYIIAGTKALSARLFSLSTSKAFVPHTFSGGHTLPIIGAFFSRDEDFIYTVSKCGVLNIWIWEEKPVVEVTQPNNKKAKMMDNWGSDSSGDEKEQNLNFGNESDNPFGGIFQSEDLVGVEDNGANRYLTKNGKFLLQARHFIKQEHSKVSSVAYNRNKNIMIVGLESGVFSLYEMPTTDGTEFAMIHSLSASTKKISCVTISPSAEWIAIGSTKLGQLVVWEWKSESYILKQQGHSTNMSCLCYSADGQTIATGGRDSKVKLWNVASGLCFATFAEHTQPITAVHIAHSKHALFSSSFDGTVRAYDLLRYRCFRIFVTPNPTQLTSVSTNASGDIVVAGSQDTFEIFVWNVQTGNLVDILSGHTGPVSGLSFSSTNDLLASCSWDKTVRIWNLYDNAKQNTEIWDHTSEVLCVRWSPNSKQVSSCTLDGQIWIWDTQNGVVINTIEARHDVMSGVRKHDKTKNAVVSNFNSISYSVDGTMILGGGLSKYLCLYSSSENCVLLDRFQVTHNKNFDGVADQPTSKDFARLEYAQSDDSDEEVDKRKLNLPGVQSGDLSSRRVLPAAQTSGVHMSPSGNGFACISTEGLLIYGYDRSFFFDPTDLDVDCTVSGVKSAIADGQFTKALVMSVKLNEVYLIEEAYYSVSPENIPTVAEQFPVVFLDRLLGFIGTHVSSAQYLEFDLLWCHHLLFFKGPYLRLNAAHLLGKLRLLHKALATHLEDLSSMYIFFFF